MRRTSILLASSFSLLIASCGGKEGTASGTPGGAAGDGGSSGTAGTAGTAGSAAGSSGAAGNSAGSGGSAGSGATGGGGASAGECTPDETRSCYTGKAGTLDVGICKSGTQKCQANGAWGLCIGEVTPLTETCDTAGDDDCDGKANEEGPSCACVPGEMGACYNGPMNTQDVGICKGGMALCNADGKGYGTCEGQVLPGPENCLQAADENCDGKTLDCTGTDTWHKKFGDAGAQTALGVAASNGGAVIVGAFAGTVNFGGGALVSGGADDAYVASYDYLGAHQWSKRFGDATAQSATGVAVSSTGDVYVVGTYTGKIDPGGGTLTSAGLTDVFLAKYDALGAFQWAKSFGDTKAQIGNGVAVDAAGNVAITGAFLGEINFGGDQLATAGNNDLFVAVLDTNGDHKWSRRFGDAAAQVGKAIAMGPMGEVVVTGDFLGALDFSPNADMPIATAGNNDVFLAAFDALGASLWWKQFGNNVAQVANSVSIDAVGSVALACTFAGKIDFGGGALTSAGGNDIGFAKFAAGGTFLWGKRYGGAGADTARGVAFDPFGAVALVGDFTGSVDFGGGALASAGATDVVVVKLDPLSAHLWSKRAGDAAAQVGSGAAADASGVFATGSFAGAIDFGGGALTSAGGNDVFLVKLSQ